MDQLCRGNRESGAARDRSRKRFQCCATDVKNVSLPAFFRTLPVSFQSLRVGQWLSMYRILCINRRSIGCLFKFRTVLSRCSKSSCLSFTVIFPVRKISATDRPGFLYQSISYKSQYAVTLQKSLVRAQYHPPPFFEESKKNPRQQNCRGF